MKLIAFYTLHAYNCGDLLCSDCPCEPRRIEVNVVLHDTELPVGRSLMMCIAMADQQAQAVAEHRL